MTSDFFCVQPETANGFLFYIPPVVVLAVTELIKCGSSLITRYSRAQGVRVSEDGGHGRVTETSSGYSGTSPNGEAFPGNEEEECIISPVKS